MAARVERMVVGGEGRVFPERLLGEALALDDTVVLADDLGHASRRFAVLLLVLPALRVVPRTVSR